jgi:hypothetical protein
LKVIQHAIERMEWVVKKVITMEGDNKYDEKRPKEVSEETRKSTAVSLSITIVCRIVCKGDARGCRIVVVVFRG